MDNSKGIERFKELDSKTKKNGGSGLSMQEVSEYRILKKEFEEKSSDKEREIKVTESQLMGMVEQMARKILKEEGQKEGVERSIGKWEEYKDDDKSVQRATLPLWSLKPSDPLRLVVKVEFYDYNFNPRTGKNDIMIYEVDLMDDKGGVETVQVEALKLMSIKERETVKLIENDRKKLRAVHGTIAVTPKNKEGYLLRRADNLYGQSSGVMEVPQEEIKYQETFTCERESGQKFKIEAKYLNT